MTRKEVERIVGIFKNHGIDKETGKRVKENVIHDFFDEIDDLMGYEGASEVIFVPEEYGLDKEATNLYGLCNQLSNQRSNNSRNCRLYIGKSKHRVKRKILWSNIIVRKIC